VRRTVVQVRVGALRVAGGTEAPDVELRAGEDAGHEHDVARPAGLVAGVRGDGEYGAAPVPEDQLQLLGVALDLTHEEGLRDFSSFRKFPNSHPARR
jgi:hypothetical protein